MKRKQVPQIMNQKWFPGFLRSSIHEFMTWFVGKVKAAKPFMPVIERGLSTTNKIVAIESNVGAGFETLEPYISKSTVIRRTSIDNFNANNEGLYVMVNTLHQLDVKSARNLLTHIAKKRQPLAFVEGNNDSLWQVVGMTIFVPLTVLFTAPFVKPFRLERLLFTYIIPILPLVTFIDGFLALFKLYAPKDLDELVAPIKQEGYTWESGKLPNGRGGKIIYLLGVPVENK
ncbi:MAG: hypothetical protein KDC92_00285 [Bacteroidetes bacterium]|nr:hypothetical protein [Bacteroidota bacterium]